MKTFNILLILIVLLLLTLEMRPALAQVEKVHADVEGITCLGCVVIMEVALKRLEEIDDLSISMSEQTLDLELKPGHEFQPEAIREAVNQGSVSIVRFQIQARGHIKEEHSGRYFVAQKNKFAVVDSPQAPIETPLRILGQVDDSVDDLPRLKILSYQTLDE
jgi:copper chaperone CopZ